MKRQVWLSAVLLAAVYLVTAVPTARAQGVEVGASLVSATIGFGEDNDVTTFGIPSSGFGVLNPGAYAAFFLGDYVAIEPHVGLLWASSDGDSFHLLNLVAQLDYFLSGVSDRSPYVFAAVGVLDVSDSDTNPKSVGGGLGFRIPSDRLTLRIDGRVTHFTEGGGNSLSLTLAIGGVFGRP